MLVVEYPIFQAKKCLDSLVESARQLMLSLVHSPLFSFLVPFMLVLLLFWSGPSSDFTPLNFFDNFFLILMLWFQYSIT